MYHDGKYALTYRSEFFFFDMMHSFISKIAADLMGMELVPTKEEMRTLKQQHDKLEEEDDEYADENDDADAIIM